MSKQIYRALIALSCLMMFSSFTSAQKSRASVPASEVNGTFRHSFAGKFKGSSSDIKILALGSGKLHIAMDLVYPYSLQNGEMSANMGSLDGEATIDGDTATYESSEFGACKISIKFAAPGTIKVAEDGQCGFGHNVSSNGTYKKVSSKKPKFGEK